jgi:methylmalonyl-CoA/ethylmalonyl-CoA epimerase
MLGKVYHTGYFTDDAAKASAFHLNTFGGEVIKQTAAPDGTKVVFIRMGESEVELIEPGDKSKLAGKTGLIIDHIGYIVKDIDAAIADLKAKGVRFQSEAPTTNMVGHRMIFLDTADSLGTRIHLTEVK